MHWTLSTALTALLAYRAHSRKSLTFSGILAAVVTALVHAVHPFSTLNICLLFGFYLTGTSATKHKHAIKQSLTISATGSHTVTTRTHTQVFSNSICASVLILIHYYLVKDDLNSGKDITFSLLSGGKNGWRDALVVGIMTQYAAVLSDTLSSELGILSRSPPRLIYNPLKVVPPGTNGGVTLAGFIAGTAGSIIIAIISVLSVPFSPENSNLQFKATLGGVIVAAGISGTIIDSLLGATLQASVIDVKAGKIVESEGGEKVLVTSTKYPSIEGQMRKRVGVASEGQDVTAKTKAVGGGEGSRKIFNGFDLLSNNGVNVVMAGIAAAGGVLWGYWFVQ
ncbi:hypothetical protein AOL_s00215g507 [Orbilia oligospora ATCC 24927]|uniref:Transmembrane protein 19 n=2 Tax=Orbilia oligospora TaxID=2813651 RepID=G1XT09_ARTOA|nr:hypothetical protein AOL_s00215g507 [Orbilia oligospora ATCC 24927]EGX43771.1 hypothetical protein AOL_s00215g507 [Orbilia oligospora ATCC 24927]KAF3274573.1 hypothetical protein TWF970_007834 [Orbilia oligospora]